MQDYKLNCPEQNLPLRMWALPPLHAHLHHWNGCQSTDITVVSSFAIRNTISAVTLVYGHFFSSVYFIRTDSQDVESPRSKGWRFSKAFHHNKYPPRSARLQEGPSHPAAPGHGRDYCRVTVKPPRHWRSRSEDWTRLKSSLTLTATKAGGQHHLLLWWPRGPVG